MSKIFTENAVFASNNKNKKLVKPQRSKSVMILQTGAVHKDLVGTMISSKH